MIGLISESLKNLLEGQMSPATKVTLLSPADASSQQRRINLFLYRVVPNPHLNNRDYQPKPGAPNQLMYPPLPLNLFYLMTPFAQLDADTGQGTGHTLMGEAMRVLYENPIVPQSALEPGLTQGQVKITLHSADTEELTKLWTSLAKELRLSAVYEVSFVDIPAKREQPVPRRVVKTDLGVAATDRRPAIAEMQPRSGPAGTVLHFKGEDLAGWKATVRVGGRLALNRVPIVTDVSFTAAVPALAPGTYEVEVDVSGLARFSDFFEVTP